jgi:hypothetical protein
MDPTALRKLLLADIQRKKAIAIENEKQSGMESTQNTSLATTSNEKQKELSIPSATMDTNLRPEQTAFSISSYLIFNVNSNF